MKRALCALFLCLSASWSSFSEPQYIIQTGHTGAITGLEYQSVSQTLVSSGNDGLVKVWDKKTFFAIQVRRLTNGPITLLAIHPLKPVYAAVSAGETGYKATVCDWKQNRELYSLSFASKPLFIDFSPRGTYLVVCVEDWSSLALFKAENGDAVSFQSAGSGIISYAVFSSKETTLMTYHPSGKIIYWELETSKKINELKTQAGIQLVMLANNKVQLICTHHDQMVVLDALSGKQTAFFDNPGLVLCRGDRQGVSLALYTRTAVSRDYIRLYGLADKAMKDIFTISVPDSNPITTLVVAEDAIFTGNENGEIFKIQKSSVERVVKNNLLPITGLTFQKNRLLLGTLDKILIYKSNLFEAGKSDSTAAVEIGYYSQPHPFAGNKIGVEFLGKQGICIWKLDNSPGALALLDSQTFALKRQAVTYPSSIVAVSIEGNAATTIEQNGYCRITDFVNPDLVFQFQTSGLNTAVYIPPARIVYGKTRLSTYESSLASIMIGTGETALLPETDDVVSDIIYQTADKKLYYSGIEKINDIPNSIIKSRIVDSSESPVRISSTPRHPYSSVPAIALNHDHNRLYFTIDDTSLCVWDGVSAQKLESALQPMKRIYSYGNVVFAQNDNGSLTAWNFDTKQILYHFYVFEDESWLIITRDGFYFCASNTNRYFTIADSDSDPNHWRLPITLTTNVKDSP